MSKNKENNENTDIPIFGLNPNVLKIKPNPNNLQQWQLDVQDRQRNALKNAELNKQKLKEIDPIQYNLLQREIAKENSPTSEIVYYEDNNGKIRSSQTNAGALSAADPLMQFYLEGVAFGRPLGYIWNKTKPIRNTLLTGDPYTTLGGKFGYYGNWFDRIRYTLDRRKTNPKILNPKHPELLRKVKNPQINLDGSIQISSPIPRADFQRVNFTTDRPVVSHKFGNWDFDDLLILNPKIVKNYKPKSIEPSDMFYTDLSLRTTPKNVTLVSGNIGHLIKAQKAGMNTLSSKELRALWKQIQEEYKQSLLRKENMSPVELKLFKDGLNRNVSPELGKKYAFEIQRLQSLRGTPSIEDYMYLDKLYGLESGTIGINELNPFIIKQIFKPGQTIRYPNGRSLDQNYFYRQINTEKDILEKAPYNKVFYDPASPVEYNYKHGLTHYDD